MFWHFQKVLLFLWIGISFIPAGFAQEIKKTSLDLPQNIEDFELIKISLMKGVRQTTFSTDSPFKIAGQGGEILMEGKRIAPTKIEKSGKGIVFGSKVLEDGPLTIESKGGAIHLKGAVYRNAIQIWPEARGTFSIVNEIPLEDYLKGVLPSEANPLWKMEALKAQAVVSRTYALFKAIENQNERFALSKDVLSQVYGGKNLEKKVTSRAVDATRGEILTYQGKIFPAYFHSTCGGGTTFAEYLWDVRPHPALRPVACDFCRSSKHYFWNADFEIPEIEKRLRQHGVKVSGIQDIQPADIDESGRAKNFLILSNEGKQKIRSNEFRIWMDPAKFKSTKIQSMQREGNRLVVKGKGWGHGVGMCQYGMKQLTELGYSYVDILQFYYRGAEIIHLEKLSGMPPKRRSQNSSWIDRAVGFFESLGE